MTIIAILIFLFLLGIAFGTGYILGFGDGNFERDKYIVDNTTVR